MMAIVHMHTADWMMVTSANAMSKKKFNIQILKRNKCPVRLQPPAQKPQHQMT